MNTVDHPLFLSFCLFLGLWLCMLAGAALHRLRRLQPDEQQGFNVILTATLTLLSLILGFSFSMANTRYDQRKGYEEAEANAIGSEYARAELLPTADAAKVHGLLREYLQQRVSFYEAGDARAPAASQWRDLANSERTMGSGEGRGGIANYCHRDPCDVWHE